MHGQTLMIQTKDKRKYYTDPANLPMLVEFAKTFGAELSLVESPDVDRLDLETLAPALCDDSYRSPRASRRVRMVHKLWPIEERESHTRKEMIHNARLIREYIRTSLEAGGTVRIAEVKQKFGELDLTDSCLSNHMSIVRKDMAKVGKRVTRVKMGVYKMGD